MAPRFSLLSISSRTPGLAAPNALVGASGECPLCKDAAVPPPPPPSLSEKLAYELRLRMGLAAVAGVPFCSPSVSAKAFSSLSAIHLPLVVRAYSWRERERGGVNQARVGFRSGKESCSADRSKYRCAQASIPCGLVRFVVRNAGHMVGWLVGWLVGGGVPVST